MSDEQLITGEPASLSADMTAAEATNTALRVLPRAPRSAASNRSYCAETAWVWQRARLVCATADPNP
jgi:hypothetical protein